MARPSESLPPKIALHGATGWLSTEERALILALAEVITPAGARVPSPDLTRLGRIELLVSELGGGTVTAFRAGLWALERAARWTTGRSFAGMSGAERAHWLERAETLPGVAAALGALAIPLKYAAAHDPRLYRALGVSFGVTPSREAPARWEDQVLDARTLTRDEAWEVDVVIVGSGAGGAPLAAGLARRGLAVLVIEAGDHYTRRDFNGDAFATARRLYLGGGVQVAWGPTPIPILAGVTVGGTTTVNSGTCFRTPDSVLDAWARETGITSLHPDLLAPHFASVESRLGVAPNPPSVLGGNARIVARGAEALGWAHAPLPRNAPGCDGQGLCCFGCPTDAKRGTALTYLPDAVQHGALIVSNAQVRQITTEDGRASGVLAETTGADGRTVRLRVRAGAVVSAGGALGSPLLLLQSGLAGSSGWVGRNLSLHPAGFALAEMDERVNGFHAVPQGYGVSEQTSQGFVLEGVFVPPDLFGAGFTSWGAAWRDEVEALDHMAAFGFMIRDTSRGRVRLGPGGKPFVTYRQNARDRALVAEAQVALATLFLAGGARAVRPGVGGNIRVTKRSECGQLRQYVNQVHPWQLALSSYHPLGTCRLGRDPHRSVVDGTLEHHDVPGLFVVDGSVLPGAPGVNPQVTIMALSEQAVDGVATRAMGGKRARTRRGRSWNFEEVLVGSVVTAIGDEEAPNSARAARDARSMPLRLELTASFLGVATQACSAGAGAQALVGELRGNIQMADRVAPCRGTLRWRPMGGKAALVYELRWAEPGSERALVLHGEKDVFLPHVVRGLTELAVKILSEADGHPVAAGTVVFRLQTLPHFLASFALRRASPGRQAHEG